MKKKISMLAIAATVTVTTLLGTSTTAFAKEGAAGVTAFSVEEQKMMRQVFDAKYYAQAYPDVVSVLGNDENKLFAHYLSAGIFEGRNASATFNADAYASANPDLVAVYDTTNNAHDLVNYVFHYLVCGKTEGRVATIADAAQKGIAVTSVMYPEKTIAAPATVGTSYVAPSSSNASYVAPSNGGNYVAPNYVSSSQPAVSAPTSTPAPAPAPDSNPYTGRGSEYEAIAQWNAESERYY